VVITLFVLGLVTVDHLNETYLESI